MRLALPGASAAVNGSGPRVAPIATTFDQGAQTNGFRYPADFVGGHRQALRQARRLPRRPRGHRAGGADRAVEGGRGGRRVARAALDRLRRGAGFQPPRQGRHVHGRPHGRRGGRLRVRRPRPAGRRREPGLPAHRRGRGRLRARVLRAGQARGGDLPRPVDADRGRRRRWPQAHLLAVAADRPAQRGSGVGRRGGRGRPGPRHLAQAGRPRGVLRQGGRGDLRGRARRAGAQRVMAKPAAILDVDGTLVDTNYQHAIAWYRAFRQHGVVLPIWRIHRHIGMGGDQLVASLASEAFDEEHGDDVRAAEKALYLSLIVEVQPLEGARELITDLRERGHAVVLASSAKPDEVDHYLELLDARGVVDGWTTSGDVEQTKPEPDLVAAAVEKAGGGKAVMVGDSTWDCESAKRAGLKSIGVLMGGFSERELLDAGAAVVHDSLVALRQNLAETPLG